MILDRYANNNYENVLNAIHRMNDIMDNMDKRNLNYGYEFTNEDNLIIAHPEAYLSMAFAMDYDDEHLESLINCLKGLIKER